MCLGSYTTTTTTSVPNAALAEDTLPSRARPSTNQTETRAESWLVAAGGVRLLVVWWCARAKRSILLCLLV